MNEVGVLTVHTIPVLHSYLKDSYTNCRIFLLPVSFRNGNDDNAKHPFPPQSQLVGRLAMGRRDPLFPHDELRTLRHAPPNSLFTTLSVAKSTGTTTIAANAAAAAAAATRFGLGF